MHLRDYYSHIVASSIALHARVAGPACAVVGKAVQKYTTLALEQSMPSGRNAVMEVPMSSVSERKSQRICAIMLLLGKPFSIAFRT